MMYRPDFSPTLGSSPEAGFQAFSDINKCDAHLLIMELISAEYSTGKFGHLADVRLKTSRRKSAMSDSSSLELEVMH